MTQKPPFFSQFAGIRAERIGICRKRRGYLGYSRRRREGSPTVRETRVSNKGISVGAASGQRGRLPYGAAVAALFLALAPSAAAQEGGGVAAPELPPASSEPAVPELVVDP